MDNNNMNINNLNNAQQPNMDVEQPKISEQPELTEQITTDEAQYRYLKELNKKLTLFKKQSDQSGKKDEEIEQTMRR
jgi:hypothetical protein